jgi:hypothetical protein
MERYEREVRNHLLVDQHGQYGLHGKRNPKKCRIVNGEAYWWLGERREGR